MLRVAITQTSRQAASTVATIVADALQTTPDLVLGLPTGRTSQLFYTELIRLHVNGRADFSRARTFNLDEFRGLEADDPRSYRTFMTRTFFDRVNLPPAHAHLPDGRARDWRAAAREYDDRIAAAGGLDLCIVGIGRNGHIAFNEPGPALEPDTHLARLTPVTRRANAHLFGGRWRQVPTHGLTMGLATILGARAVVLLATGREKAAIVRRALTGKVTTRLPASLLQLHPHALVVLDRRAAGALRPGAE